MPSREIRRECAEALGEPYPCGAWRSSARSREGELIYSLAKRRNPKALSALIHEFYGSGGGTAVDHRRWRPMCMARCTGQMCGRAGLVWELLDTDGRRAGEWPPALVLVSPR